MIFDSRHQAGWPFDSYEDDYLIMFHAGADLVVSENIKIIANTPVSLRVEWQIEFFWIHHFKRWCHRNCTINFFCC